MPITYHDAKTLRVVDMRLNPERLFVLEDGLGQLRDKRLREPNAVPLITRLNARRVLGDDCKDAVEETIEPEIQRIKEQLMIMGNVSFPMDFGLGHGKNLWLNAPDIFAMYKKLFVELGVYANAY